METVGLIEKVMLAVPDLIYIYDLQAHRNIYTNRELFHILGYRPEELHIMGEHAFARLVHPDDIPFFSRMLEIQLALKESEVLDYQYRMMHADGSYRWLHARETVFQRDLTGRVEQLFGIAQDITEQKNITDALRISEEWYRLAVQNLPDAILLQDRDLTYVWMIHSLPKLLPAQVVGQSDHQLKEHFPHLAPLIPIKQQVMHTRQSEQVEVAVVADDATHYYEITLMPREQPDGTVIGVSMYGREITEKKRMDLLQLEQERLKTALAKEQEINEFKSRLMLRVSHEFRTPFTVMTNSVEILERHFDRLTPEARFQRLQLIHNEIQRVARMLDQMTQTLRNQLHKPTLQPSQFDLSQLCQEVITTLEQTMGQAHQLRFEWEGVCHEFTGDREMIYSVINNLISNAIKYSPENSEIVITMRDQAPEQVTLQVRDHGYGIASHEISQIFEPFFRGQHPIKITGMGLGLNIVKEIIDLHGGTIQVHSEAGRGTIFTINLPYMR
ncbi:MAG: ATP-binding protein [Anaerolineae bacterium]|jgi:PAS domain S-box-containing protein|nr:ATP-binding protein [Anaerolineae bacterium]